MGVDTLCFNLCSYYASNRAPVSPSCNPIPPPPLPPRSLPPGKSFKSALPSTFCIINCQMALDFKPNSIVTLTPALSSNKIILSFDHYSCCWFLCVWSLNKTELVKKTSGMVDHNILFPMLWNFTVNGKMLSSLYNMYIFAFVEFAIFAINSRWP